MALEDRLDVRAFAEAGARRLHDATGRPVVVVVARVTYEVDAGGVVRFAREPSPIRWSDEIDDREHLLGGARSGSIRFPSDQVVFKPGTDVLLVGTACPPSGRIATETTVTLRMGPVDKTVRIVGPRVYYEGPAGVVPSPAATVGPTPLLYDYAFGGADPLEPSRYCFENPIGLGFAADRRRLVGRPAPLIESLSAPTTSAVPRPAGFGPIASSWSPRLSRYGTADEAWAHERAPLLPLDYSPRHACSSPDDQWSAAPLRGDEPVEVLGVLPQGAWRFSLPPYALSFSAVVSGAQRELPTHLDTIVVDADDQRVELTWRASIVVPGKAELIERLFVFGSPDPSPMFVGGP